MMYGWDYHMAGSFSVLCFLLWLVVFVDLILVGVWLWQQVNKKK